MYELREKMAYSVTGKFLATIIKNNFFPNSRVHWVQQALADLDFTGLND